jgi:proteasome lid subunit RPN8/RPN11
MALILSPADYAAMLDHVQAECPNEACGLLAGSGADVRRIYPVENLAHSPTVYEMNPAGQIAAFLAMEALGWELSGIYHSHPAGPAEPSPTDIAQAYYPDSIYVIISPGASGAWQARGFQIAEGRVREVPLEVRQGV